jgi:hypothetical protein
MSSLPPGFPESVPPLMSMPPTSLETQQMAQDGSRLAEDLWTLADGIGNAKIAWRSQFTAEELAAADLLTSALLRLGGQAKRGEIASGRG